MQNNINQNSAIVIYSKTVSHKWNAIYLDIMSWTQKEENECWVFETSLKGVFESVASKNGRLW